MSWVVEGRVFDPAEHGWIYSHAQVPTPMVMDGHVRVFFSPRSPEGRSYVAFFDLATDNLMRVVRTSEGSVFEHGEPGTFDEDGVMPGCILRQVDDLLWMYYNGWNQKVSTPYHNATGIAVSDNGGRSFRRLYKGPVMDRTPTEPYLAVTPTILVEGGVYRCWYVSGLRWVEVAGHLEPVYVIKYAQSEDGVTWQRDGVSVIEQSHPLEAISHPTVEFDGERYHMWFCYRDSTDFRGGGGSYQIGYAHSEDGHSWQRTLSDSRLVSSGEAWDSDMACYPSLFSIHGTRYLLYNGNGFGRSGVGLARWEP